MPIAPSSQAAKAPPDAPTKAAAMEERASAAATIGGTKAGEPEERPVTALLCQLIAAYQAAGCAGEVDWATHELRGYSTFGRNPPEVPDYRAVRGLPMGFSPVQGWVPLFIADEDMREWAAEHLMRQAVPQIENALLTSRNGKAYVHFPEDQIFMINALSERRFEQMASCIDHSELRTVLLRVKERTEAALATLTR